MIDRTDKFLFLAGLIIFSIGQFWIYHFGATTKASSPIDVSHWIMLVGTTLYLPFIMRLPRNGVAVIASVLMTIGVVCMIGMCVIDFVFWSIADDELRGMVAKELSSTPMIWQPFMLWGNEEVLMTGFVVASLLYIKQSKIGPLLVLTGAIVAVAGTSWFNLLAYVLTTLGFVICFNFLKPNELDASHQSA